MTETTSTSAPRVFISYSWSSQDHIEWVISLATELRQSGVDVILDKWDLKEGDDANAFMERMVTDASIDKVLMICDRTYVSKADSRKGGVGSEAQIVSSTLYERIKQNKFVALLRERDDDGKALVPVYYGSRIHIDYSDPTTTSEAFEQLLRWAFDKPLHIKPPLGAPPEFLKGDVSSPTLATSATFKRAVDAIKNSRPHVTPAVKEYFALFTSELEKFRIQRDDGTPYDELPLKNISDFVPFRNEALELITTLAAYRPTQDTPELVHRFLEHLLPYMDRPPHLTSWQEYDFDNFKFVVGELFLYVIAICLKHEQFSLVSHLLDTNYYCPTLDRGGDGMASFSVFRPYLGSLEHRKNRLQLDRTSIHSDLIKARCIGVSTTFGELSQADFTLFVRGIVKSARWYGPTLIWVADQRTPFEIFARARSTRYFERIGAVLGTNNPADVRAAIERAKASGDIPRWTFYSLDVGALSGADRLATSA